MHYLTIISSEKCIIKILALQKYYKWYLPTQCKSIFQLNILLIKSIFRQYHTFPQYRSAILISLLPIIPVNPCSYTQVSLIHSCLYMHVQSFYLVTQGQQSDYGIKAICWSLVSSAWDTQLKTIVPPTQRVSIANSSETKYRASIVPLPSVTFVEKAGLVCTSSACNYTQYELIVVVISGPENSCSYTYSLSSKSYILPSPSLLQCSLSLYEHLVCWQNKNIADFLHLEKCLSQGFYLCKEKI